MIDTHCHLTSPRLIGQLGDVLRRAADAGVGGMITIGTDVADARAAVELCSHHPDHLRCVVGVHPHQAGNFEPSHIDELRQIQRDDSVVAVGETGLDYHYDFAPKERQKSAFEAQLDLAAGLGRPVVIHCREAVDDTLAIMRAFPDVVADFHCFTGTIDEATRILDAGHYLGFTGVVTFRKSVELQKVAAFVPAERFMIETDAPFLSPEPMRKQKTNEPALVVHTAAKLAAIRGVDVRTIAAQSDTNARRLFGCDDFAKGE